MKKLLYYCLPLLLAACKEKYDAPVNVPSTGYLVVEGSISPGGVAEIHMSRTIPLSDTAHHIYESKATVKVQGRDNSSYTLSETSTGYYYNNLLNLNKNQQYRLYIKTRDGKEYASDYVAVRSAPNIDGIQWTRDNAGVHIFVNTHDPNNNTWYYRWSTEETWEFHSSYYTNLDFLKNSSGNITGVKYRYPDQHIDISEYTCWQYANSTDLKLGSSAKLSRDSISFPLVDISTASWKLSVLYSINVKQYALTKDEYEYLEKMKRNSEGTGSIFDQQPSELAGNIHCITNSSEPVIGFISIAGVQTKRIFIKNIDVPDWGYHQYCDSKEITSDSADDYSFYTPTTPLEFVNGNVSKYLGATPACVLCTLSGTNIKPSYWP